jgi:hypothetical protein
VPSPKKRGNQLFLFAPPAAEEPEPDPDPALAEIIETLESMSVDDLTPRQALDRLAALKELSTRRKKR